MLKAPLNISMNRVFCTLVAMATCVSAPPLHAANWPLGRADAAGSGATTEELPEKLELLWEVDSDAPAPNPLGFDAGPVIAFGTVFAADHDGRIIALDLATGKQRWRVMFEAGFVASPAFDKGVLYAGDEYGNLYALDAETGKQRWTFATGLEIDAGPNFYGDSVLVTSQDGTLYALLKDTGELKWKYETGDQLQCGATLAGNRTFLGGCDQHLHIIDVQTGKAIGEPFPLDAPTGSTPSVWDKTVFVPTYAGEIFAFSADQSEPIWRFRNEDLSSEFKNSVAVANGIVVAASRMEKRIFALDAKSGELKWEQVLRKRSDASPVIAGKSVIITAADGRIIRFDLQTGQETWMMEVKAGFIGSAAVADGKLVVANDRGTIFCFGEKK